MNKKMIFASGLILGFAISYFILNSNQKSEKMLTSTQITDLETRLHTSEEEQLKLKNEMVEIKTKYALGFEKNRAQANINMTSEIQQAQVIEKPLKASMEMFDKMKQPEKRRKKVNLSYETILDLEEQWAQLPQQVQLTKEDRGWRIKSIQPHSVFSNVGLNQGDLITEKFIKELDQSSEGQSSGEMEKRVMNILNHVTVQ